MTPGAAVATKSNARASGPMRPNTGTRGCTLRYSRSDASVSIGIANTPGCTCARLEADRRVLEQRGEVALGVDLDEQDPLAHARRRAAPWPRSTVLFPTPPLPVKKSRRRSSRSAQRPSDGRSASGRSRRAGCAVFLDLDVGDLVGRGADPAALDVGQPDHRRADRPSAVVDGLDHVFGTCRRSRGQFLGGVHDADPKLHVEGI